MDNNIRQDIVVYRVNKAHQLLHDIDILIENELWNSTINRMYYACFHAVSALLIKNGIEEIENLYPQIRTFISIIDCLIGSEN